MRDSSLNWSTNEISHISLICPWSQVAADLKDNKTLEGRKGLGFKSKVLPQILKIYSSPLDSQWGPYFEILRIRQT